MHKAAGRDVVIVSTSGEEVVAPIGAMLGADEVVATRMVVADGKYTGEIELYAFGPEKASAVLRLAEERGYDLAGSYAYSDSVTDAPMLEAGRTPLRVNPTGSAGRERSRLADAPFSNAVPCANGSPDASGAPGRIGNGGRRRRRRGRARLVRIEAAVRTRLTGPPVARSNGHAVRPCAEATTGVQ